MEDESEINFVGQDALFCQFKFRADLGMRSSLQQFTAYMPESSLKTTAEYQLAYVSTIDANDEGSDQYCVVPMTSKQISLKEEDSLISVLEDAPDHKQTKSMNTSNAALKSPADKENEVYYHCTLCNFRFASKNNYIDHMATHESDTTGFQCKTCNVMFTKCSSWMEHCHVLHASEEKYKCTICTEKFVCELGLKIHNLTHLQI